METITEIKKIEIELLPDGRHTVKINDGGDGEVEYKVPAENYRQWARIFSRIAMEMWHNMDVTELQSKEE